MCESVLAQRSSTGYLWIARMTFVIGPLICVLGCTTFGATAFVICPPAPSAMYKGRSRRPRCLNLQRVAVFTPPLVVHAAPSTNDPVGAVATFDGASSGSLHGSPSLLVPVEWVSPRLVAGGASILLRCNDNVGVVPAGRVDLEHGSGVRGEGDPTQVEQPKTISEYGALSDKTTGVYRDLHRGG